MPIISTCAIMTMIQFIVERNHQLVLVCSQLTKVLASVLVGILDPIWKTFAGLS